jgi:acyl-CoA synthetase (AMP-forming)/AMP-acid ligase II
MVSNRSGIDVQMGRYHPQAYSTAGARLPVRSHDHERCLTARRPARCRRPGAEFGERAGLKLWPAILVIGYGMTELSPACTVTTLSDPFAKSVSTVGRAYPQVECKIVDPSTDRVVPRGTPGEMLARGDNVMLGYWNNPKATAEAIERAGCTPATW